MTEGLTSSSTVRTRGTTLAVMAELRPAQFREIAAIMQREARIHLVEAKLTLVQSRLSKRLREHGLGSFVEYVDLVHRNAQERHTMVVALTTNHTHFFRENHHFEHLKKTALPMLQARAQRKEKVRLWSAGCSSGEEVYSMVMTLAGESPGGANWMHQNDVRILATDIAPHVVQSVHRAQYSASTVEPVPSALRQRWMQQLPEGDYCVAEPIRSLVSPRILNLFDEWPMRCKYDVIFCRNVMIYFDDTAKAELEARFVDMLTPGGFLYIGHSERLIGAAVSKMQPVGQTIYMRKDTGGVR